MPSNTKIALIDGDILLYRVAFACQHTDYKVYVQGEESAGMLAQFPNKTELNAFLKQDSGVEYTITATQWEEPLANALHSVQLMLQNILQQIGCSKYKLFLTGDNSYRHKILPSYKAGRSARPVLYSAIKEYLIDKCNAKEIHEMEADDALGIHQTQAPAGSTIICTVDKDLLMIPGEHYNFVTDIFRTVTEQEGSLTFDKQVLTGDGVDNICGIKGLGPKTAAKLLDGKGEQERLKIIQEQYQKYWGEGWEEVLDCNSKLLWILREPLYHET